MVRPLIFAIWDSADPGLLGQMIEGGELPHLASLVDASRAATVVNDPGIYVEAIWASLITGLPPTEHGRFCHAQINPGTYDITPSDDTTIDGPTFWGRLTAGGVKTAVIDVTNAPMRADDADILVCDWATHEKDGPMRSIPSDLTPHLVGRYGADTVESCDGMDHSPAGFAALVEGLEKRIADKTDYVDGLIQAGDHQLIILSFSDPHCVAHQCWHLHDVTHVDHDPDLARSLGFPVQRIYQALDASLGRLLAAADKDWSVALLASHGTTNAYHGSHLGNRLARGISHRLRGGRHLSGSELAGLAIDRWKSRNRLPRWAREVFPPERNKSHYQKVFCLPTNSTCLSLRLNLVGREPFGRIGIDEKSSVEREIVSLLEQVRRVGDNEKAFSNIYVTDEIYPNGQNRDRLPDIMAEWSRVGPFDGLILPGKGRPIRGRYKGHRTGDHTNEGWLLHSWDAEPSLPIQAIGPLIERHFGRAVAEASSDQPVNFRERVP